MQNREVLKCENLSIGYGRAVCKCINLSLKRGQTLWVKGDNGSGKSTLVKTLTGEISPLKGTLKCSIPPAFISVLPQTVNIPSYFSYTMEEIWDTYDVPEEYRKLCPEEMANRKWNESSRGEKQKTLILTRFKKDTEVLILDEPFNHVSSEGIASIRDLLCGILEKDDKLTLIIVSHRQIKEHGFDVVELCL